MFLHSGISAQCGCAMLRSFGGFISVTYNHSHGQCFKRDDYSLFT
jgi:hypothetical protein